MLTSAASEFEAEAIAEALRAQEIPAEVFGGVAKAGLQWDIGFTDPIKVMVRRADVDRAGGVLRAVRAESVDIDWAEVQPDVEGAWTPRATRPSLLARRSVLALTIFLAATAGFALFGTLQATVGMPMWRATAFGLMGCAIAGWVLARRAARRRARRG